MKEAKSQLSFERIKKPVNIGLEELQEDVLYEKINQVDDDLILLDFGNRITRNEGVIQTCTKYTKFRKASHHAENLLIVIKRTGIKIVNNNHYSNDEHFFNIATATRSSMELKRSAPIKTFIDASYRGGIINSSLSYSFIRKNIEILMKAID